MTRSELTASDPVPEPVVITRWCFVEEAERLDPLWRFRFTKASSGHCSAPMCEDPVDILVTRPHKRNGCWTRGLCREHALRYRKDGPGAHT